MGGEEIQMAPLRQIRRIAASLLAAVLLVGSSGCSSITDRAVEKIVKRELGGYVDFDGDDDSVRVETDEGLFTSGTTIPEDWPSDVPIPPDLEVSGSSVVRSYDEKSFSLHRISQMSTKEIKDFYADAFSDWEETREVEVGVDQHMVQVGYQKGEMSMSVSVFDQDGGRNVTILVQMPK